MDVRMRLHIKWIYDICERYTEHPFSKVVFKDIRITDIGKVVDVACKLHGRTPYIGMIGWDFQWQTMDSCGH